MSDIIKHIKNHAFLIWKSHQRFLLSRFIIAHFPLIINMMVYVSQILRPLIELVKKRQQQLALHKAIYKHNITEHFKYNTQGLHIQPRIKYTRCKCTNHKNNTHLQDNSIKLHKSGHLWDLFNVE